MAKKIILTVLLILLCLNPAVAGENNGQVPVLIQVSSNLSDGRLSSDEIMHIAEGEGFKAVVFTDREIMRWEYGLWPLRNLLKKKVEQNSIFKYGISKYFEYMRELKKRFPDMAIILGAETTPYYYWMGNPFKGGLKLFNAHKHLLVFGFQEPEQLEKIPVVNNKKALYKQFKPADLFLLWPVITLFIGIVLVNKRNNVLAGGFIFISLLFFINNYPYRKITYDQYSADIRTSYQRVIDYSNSINALTFWAHPEAKYYQKTGAVEIITDDHAEELINTQNFTGFCVFYEGYEKTGRPGGLWDKILIDYLDGKRQKPIWAIGGSAFDYDGDFKERCKDLVNMVIADKVNEADILEAIRKGKVYVNRGKEAHNFILEDFSVYNGAGKKTMGEQIVIEEQFPIIKIKAGFRNAENLKLKINVIKNGKVIKKIENDAPIEEAFTDDSENDLKQSYYRLEIKAEGLHVISNPVFVERQGIGNRE